MTPGQRRRLDRRYARNEGRKDVNRYLRSQPESPDLMTLPHPKRSTGTAHDYVEWLIENGYGHKALAYLQSL